MFEMINVAFWVKLHSFLNLWQTVWCVFCYQSVCVFFTNGVYRKLFTMFFITTICVYDFCETVLVKNTHLAKVWFEFSLPKCCIFTLAFWWYCTNSLVSLEMPKRKWQGCCPRAPAGAYAPRTLRSSVLKKELPASSFLQYILPRKCTLLTLSVNSLICIHINTHVDMSLNNVTCMLVVLFFLCIRKHESKLPTNILTRTGK